jgi:hypothetical protein
VQQPAAAPSRVKPYVKEWFTWVQLQEGTNGIYIAMSYTNRHMCIAEQNSKPWQHQQSNALASDDLPRIPARCK